MEFEDKDGDGVGDSADKCVTPSGEGVASDGCAIEEEVSSLVVILVSGVVVLLVIVIGLMLIIMKKKSNDTNENSVSVYHDDTLFDNEPAAYELPTNLEPSISDTGQVTDDGNEWLEFPSGSGIWYWRRGYGTPWTKH